MPESLVRVQKLTGKSITFYEADLCSKESLRAVMSKVGIMLYIKHSISNIVTFVF